MASGFHQEPNSNCCDGVDRISSLPDKAISKILVCLPIKDAVATSKLSTTWRYKWISIPELVFDEHAYAGGEASDDQRVSFINSVFLLHDGDITKFEIRDLLDFASSYMDRWLLLLSRKKLTNLLIEFQEPNFYVCHTCLFYCEALTTLKLKFCQLQLPPRTQINGFKNLIVLDLEEVDANKETIEFVVNSSPLLQSLVIKSRSSVSFNLHISAPNLRKCVIHGHVVTFVKTPELIHTDIKRLRSWRCRLDGIIGGLDKIQKAAFSRPVIEDWRNKFTYHHLNHLRLEIYFEDPEQVLAALWLSDCSPSLKTIYIKVISFQIRRRRLGAAVPNLDAIPKLQELYDLFGESKYVLQSLDTFELEGFGGTINELRFIQFILLHASVLQTMKIGWENRTWCHKRDGALVELVQFQRSSPGVKIKLYVI